MITLIMMVIWILLGMLIDFGFDHPPDRSHIRTIGHEHGLDPIAFAMFGS